jgi:hypothetical protein
MQFIKVKMDLVKSSLGLEKQKHSDSHNTKRCLLDQMTVYFNHLEKTEEDSECLSQQGANEDEKNKGETEEVVECLEEVFEEEKHKIALKIARNENKLNYILLEMLETERNYVKDLEEVSENVYQPIRAFQYC